MENQTKEHIHLCALNEDDIDTLFALTSDPKVARFMRFQTHTERSQAEALYREYTENGNYGYLIALPDGSPVGAAALKQNKEEDDFASISIFTFQKYWNHGYSTQVIEELLKEARLHKITYIRAYVVDKNAGSRRILEKSGFHVEETFPSGKEESVIYIYSYHIED